MFARPTCSASDEPDVLERLESDVLARMLMRQMPRYPDDAEAGRG